METCQLCHKSVPRETMIACSGYLYECITPCTPTRKSAYEDAVEETVDTARDKEYSSGVGSADAQLREMGVTRRALKRIPGLRRNGVIHYETKELDHAGLHYHYCFKSTDEGGSQWLRFPLRK